jgi:hypothetical protein
MNPNHPQYSDTRIQDFWREYRQSADFYGLPVEPGIGHKVRENAGKALISLGAWIMPRRRSNKLSPVWVGR